MTTHSPRNKNALHALRGAVRSALLATAALLLFQGGCGAPRVSDASQDDPYFSSCESGPTLRRSLDVLFVIDNSVNMTRKQLALVNAVPRFVRALDDLDLDYHIGVVTTDIGANPTATSGFPGNRTLPGCGSFSGDDGRLQNTPCSIRGGLSADAASTCTAVCPDPRYVPNNGAVYIERKNGVYNVPSKRDTMGREIGPETALGCMAFLGDGGCGIEAPLESAKRALDGHLNENSGFLRTSSSLAVIFVTDEDDCAVQISQRLKELDPARTDCSGDMSPLAPGSCFSPDFRCTARGIECQDANGIYQPMTAPGPKMNCREKANNPLIPIKNYMNFFKSLRPTSKLVFAGILPPSLLDAPTGAEPGKLIVEQDPAGEPGTPGLVRGRKDRAACYNPAVAVGPDGAEEGFIGKAQLRLSTFLRSMAPASRSETSICEPDAYTGALMGVTAQLRDSQSPTYCLGDPSRFALDAEGKAQCLVGTAGGAGGVPAAQLPRCSATCCSAWKSAARPAPADPGIAAACAMEPVDCYCVEENSYCSGLAGGIWRRDTTAPLPSESPCFSCLMKPTRLELQPLS